jgi:hypothetical protein
LSEKTCPSATFVHHKIPHDQTRVFWTWAAAVWKSVTNRLSYGAAFLLVLRSIPTQHSRYKSEKLHS